MKQKNVYFKFKQTRIVVPPFLFSLFLLFFFTNNTVRSQGLTNKCFRNSFGSHALIQQHRFDGTFEGFYGSSTGSTGVFRIIGNTPRNVDMSKSFPVTFTIGWGTLKDKSDDASQYWSSTMSGSYDHKKKELNLLNVISAPGAFEALSIFNPGNLPQSQLFTTVPIKDCDFLKDTKILTPSDKKSPKDNAYETLLKGTWKVNSQNTYGLVTKIYIMNLEAKGNSYSEPRYYKVRGNFSLSPSMEVIPFIGIASPYLPEEKNNTDFSFAISLVGTVPLTNGDPYNISLSGFSSGDGTRSINMFLTKSKSMSSDKPEIDDNQISTGEIFNKI